jgi:phage gp29-like protein
METIISMLAGQIEDQKLWVEDMKLAIDKYYEETLDPMIQSTVDTFDRMTSTYSEARENLKNMRRSLEYAIYAAGRDLDPDQRQTPELYV